MALTATLVFLNITLHEESFLPKRPLAVSLKEMSPKSHWLLCRPHCMKVPWPLLSLLRRLMMPSLLRAGGLLLLSDWAEEVELLRLSVAWLDMAAVSVVEALLVGCCCIVDWYWLWT